jgi:hypothetical protein
MIQLAASVWNTSIRGTLLKLESLGFNIPGFAEDRDYTIRCYERFLGRQKRYRDLWAEAGDGRVTQQKEPRAALTAMGIGTQFTGKIKSKMPVGSHTCDAIIDTYKPGQRHRSETRKGTGSFHSKYGGLYRGGGWSEVIVMPFYDLPNRISMFRTWGRYGRDREIGEATVCRSKDADAGLSFDLDLLKRKKKTVFAFQDVNRYLKLQFKSLRQQQGLLPLVLWHTDDHRKTRKAWRMLSHHKIVFWAPEVTPDLMLQAILANGFICHTNAGSGKEKQIHELFEKHTPDSTLTRMKGQARHWTYAMDKFCKEADPAKVEELFLFLRVEKIGVERVLEAVHSSTADMARSMLHEDKYRRYQVGNTYIVEQNGIWYREHNTAESDIVSNCVYRLDDLVRYPNSDKMQYRGRAFFKGQEIPFTADLEKFERNPLKWLHDELVARNIGVVSYDRQWSCKTLEVVKRAHTPKLITGIDRTGWNEDRYSISFPKFEIEFGGDIHVGNAAYAAGLPCSNMAAPNPEHSIELRRLTNNTPMLQHFWALFTHIAANLVAPACNRSQRGLVYSGRLADQAATMVQQAFDLRRCRQHPIEKLLEFEQANDVPPLVQPLGRFDYETYLDATEGARNVIISAPLQTAMAIGINRHWCVIPSEDNGELDEVHIPAMTLSLSLFMEFLLRRQLREMNRDGDHWLLVQDALRLWFKMLDFDLQVLAGAEKLLMSHNKSCLPIELLSLPYRKGELTIEPEDFVTDNCLISLNRTDLFIPEQALRRAASVRNRMSIDFSAITRLLSESPDYVGEDFIHNQNGWVIKQSWWNQTIRRTAERVVPRLKVTG